MWNWSRGNICERFGRFQVNSPWTVGFVRTSVEGVASVRPTRGKKRYQSAEYYVSIRSEVSETGVW